MLNNVELIKNIKKIRQKSLAISKIKYYIRYYRKKERGMNVKNFFGSIFINRDRLKEAGIDYPIKVEYYKITNEQEKIKQNKLKYGIQIIKTEYKDKIGVEQNKIEDITNDENEITKILYLMKNNEVTPIGLEDVILEIKNRQAIAKNKKLSYNT